MKRNRTLASDMSVVLLLVVLLFILLACSMTGLLSQANEPGASSSSTVSAENPAVSSTSTAAAEIPPTQAPIPDGWVLSKDESGTCQVAAPPGWKLGTDFFLAAENIDPGPIESAPGEYPPMGLALWGVGEGTPAPEGHFFQIRTSRVVTEKVCSVWRIKADVDFTDAEKSELEQVGTTLQEVQ
jgi:hypothetical protein